jgi:plastocyanin
VVYVETEESVPFEPPVRPAVMDQRGLEFIPHVLPVLLGTRVAFVNSDPVGHNVFSASAPKPFNLGTYPSGVSRYVTFDRPGVMEILCNVHPEMVAYILVLETPYFTLTDEQGRYRIRDLPPGSHSAWVWCEVQGSRSRPVQLGPGVTRLDFERVP